MMMTLSTVDQLSRSVQDYLKAIYTLTRSEASTSTVRLADALGVAPASVSNMLQKLSEGEPPLVDYHKHRGAALTAEGEQAALRVIRRHRLLEQFLFEVLGYPWERVHAEAEELEHVISPYFEDRLAEFLGNPAFDPHGDPIPNRALEMTGHAGLISLGKLAVGQRGVVRQVTNTRPEVLSFLAEVGVRLGSRVRVLQRNPVDGAVRAAVDGQYEDQVLSTQIADSIFVQVSGE
jgi:DtxR family Mn-dependent transcriptional regulator